MAYKEYKASPYFRTLDLQNVYNKNIAKLTDRDCSLRALDKKQHFLTGDHIFRGIPFKLGREGNDDNLLVVSGKPVEYKFAGPAHDRFFIFLHTADFKEIQPADDGIFSPMKGLPELGEKVCEYVFKYEDGTVVSIPARRRFNISEFEVRWGANSFECVPYLKPFSVRSNTEEFFSGREQRFAWGQTQTRVNDAPECSCAANHWLYAAENPHPSKHLVSISFIPADGTVFIFGITGCCLEDNPLRWESRKKLKLTIPAGLTVNELSSHERIHIDLGQIISAYPALDYSNPSWEEGYNNKQPAVSKEAVIVEYTANPHANLYLCGNEEVIVPLDGIAANEAAALYACPVNDARKPVTIRIIDHKTGKAVPVKIHVHGQHGEYLAPLNRHRIPNPYWFEDYSADFVHGSHFCTYIDGEAEFRLPLGEIFVEVSKGFEIRPVRKRFAVEDGTDTIVIPVEKVLDWRERGWVTADTHVHFLSPRTALLEGEAEGVNVVNLLASQWGELFTNIGDFDGRTTFGSIDTGGTGEYLVRVGTENRQHILGHISLLGYEGKMILPLTTGGPDESALGDPVEETLSGWAKRCREQNGISILPHFPNPRAEGAAALVLEMIDGVEMTSWGDLYSGISPYSLSDWYRYLNCGYQVPAVGGTDKMSADTAVGTVRTYALIQDAAFTYDSWKESVKRGITFVTYGPLLEFYANGCPMGARIDMPSGGGTVEIDWHVASVTVPVTKVELVVNGRTKEIKTVNPGDGDYYGRWSVKMPDSGWIALRVRGGHAGKPEMIAAHSSAILVSVDGKKCFNTADAVTILDQIEGSVAYVKSLGTQAEQQVFHQILATLTGAHRALHNRLHQNGVFHDHTAVDDHHHK